MRRVAVAAAVALAALAAAGSGVQAASTGAKPIRIALALPAAGEASTALLRLPLTVEAGAAPRLRVVVKAERPLPAGVVATYRALRRGSTLYVGPSFVIPHVLERSSSIDTTRTTFDTTLFSTYTSGVVGAGSGNAPVLDVYVFADGKPVDPGRACTGCEFALAAAPRKLLVRVDDLIAHTSNVPYSSVCKLGFAALAVRGADDVSLQGFVVNSHTGAFDLSAFGAEPAAIAAAVETDVAQSVCGGGSGADALRSFAQPPSAPTSGGFTVAVDATHHHGTGSSNLCVRVRTTPAQQGSATVTLAGPSGAGTKTVQLGSDGSGVAVFPISQYGAYSAQAAVGGTSGSASYTVDGSAGQAFSCPAP